MSTISVPVYESMIRGKKRGLPRATRFIFVELRMEAKRRHPIPLARDMDDVDALHDLLGGPREEMEAAVRQLTDAKDPAIRIEGESPDRVVRILSLEAEPLEAPSSAEIDQGVPFPLPSAPPSSQALAADPEERRRASDRARARRRRERLALERHGQGVTGTRTRHASTVTGTVTPTVTETVTSRVTVTLTGGVGGDLSSPNFSSFPEIPLSSGSIDQEISPAFTARGTVTGTVTPTVTDGVTPADASRVTESVTRDARPSRPVADRATRAMEDPYLLQAYAEGLGGGFAPDRRHAPIVRAVVDAFAPDLRTVDEVAKWVTPSAHAYRAFLDSLPESELAFWSRDPGGWRRWMNEGAPPRLVPKRPSGTFGRPPRVTQTLHPPRRDPLPVIEPFDSMADLFGLASTGSR